MNFRQPHYGFRYDIYYIFHCIITAPKANRSGERKIMLSFPWMGMIHVQADQHWNCFKGYIVEAPWRQCRAHTGLSMNYNSILTSYWQLGLFVGAPHPISQCHYFKIIIETSLDTLCVEKFAVYIQSKSYLGQQCRQLYFTITQNVSILLL